MLFVDDEQNVLHALARQVHGVVHAELATSPVRAARLLEVAGSEGGPGYAAIVSDMRMPEMDGAALLKHARAVSPDTTRLLLTGYTDIDTAIEAVNEGNIFRFLTKPCATGTLRNALDAALEQHQLLRDQRELLDSTLRGAVEALVETLAMAHPAAFARASRLRRITAGVAASLGLPDAWQVEVAAQLAEIGIITLPDKALEALAGGAPADRRIVAMLERLPGLADGLLARIPRLDAVRAIVRQQESVDSPDPARLRTASLSARVLQAVREYDAATARGLAQDAAIGLLRQRSHHEPLIVEALRELVHSEGTEQIREVAVADLQEGDVLAANLLSSTGLLLVARGQALTEQLVVRLRNYATLVGLAGRPLVVDPSGPDGAAPRRAGSES